MIALIDKLMQPPRLGKIGIALLCGWTLGFLLYHGLAHQLVSRDNVVIGRDFLAFYTAGQVINSGQADQLYDPVVQQETQRRVLGGETMQGLSYFINPASVAVVYAALARLPYLGAFYLHTALMAGAFFFGVWCLRRELEALHLHWSLIGCLGISWMPMMHTVQGGQNAALSFALLSLAFAATRRNHEMVAGVALGLLMFKPQYGLPVLGLLLLRGRWMTVAVAALVSAAQYVVGAVVCGWDWPIRMAQQLGGYYREAEDTTNAATHIALLEVLDYSIIAPLAGPDSALGDVVRIGGYLIIAAMILGLIWLWRDARTTDPRFGLYWAIMTSATLLISLHTQYYDAALLVLPVLLILSHVLSRPSGSHHAIGVILLIAYVGYLPLVEFPRVTGIPFQPAVLLPLWVTAWGIIRLRAARGGSP